MGCEEVISITRWGSVVGYCKGLVPRWRGERRRLRGERVQKKDGWGCLPPLGWKGRHVPEFPLQRGVQVYELREALGDL